MVLLAWKCLYAPLTLKDVFSECRVLHLGYLSSRCSQIVSIVSIVFWLLLFLLRSRLKSYCFAFEVNVLFFPLLLSLCMCMSVVFSCLTMICFGVISFIFILLELFSCCSAAEQCPTLCDPRTAAHQASLSVTISWSLPKLICIELVMPSCHLLLCCPLLLLPSILPSIRVFSNESALHIRWPKYWSFSFSICPSNEHSRLISLRMDWLDLLAVQGTLKSLLQHHTVQKHQFFGAQLSFPYSPNLMTIHEY